MLRGVVLRHTGGPSATSAQVTVTPEAGPSHGVQDVEGAGSLLGLVPARSWPSPAAPIGPGA